MKSMNILILLNIDFGIHGPSVHLFVDIIQALTQRGHFVTVISKAFSDRYPHYPESLADCANLKVIPLVCKTDKHNLFKRFFIDAKYAKDCSKTYKKNNYDVAFLQSCNSAFFHVKYLKKYTNAKVLFNVQDVFPQNTRKLYHPPLGTLIFHLFYWMQRYAYIRSDKIITISSDMAETIKEDKSIKTPINVIHNWGYLEHTMVINDENNQFIEKLGQIGDEFRAVYAGNIGRQQNVELIIRAAKRLVDTDIKFYIIGNGVKKPSIVEYIQNNDLCNVVMMDAQPEHLAQQIYSMADVNMIPLLPYTIYTALPSKTAACLSCGRTIVGCFERESELGRLFESTEGCYVVSNHDENELAALLTELSKQGKRKEFTDREEAMNMFSIRKNIDLYVDCIESLCGE